MTTCTPLEGWKYEKSFFCWFIFLSLTYFCNQKYQKFRVWKNCPFATLSHWKYPWGTFTFAHRWNCLSSDSNSFHPRTPRVLFIFFFGFCSSISLSLPYVSVLESVREDFREKWQTVWARNEASFCHLENRSVTDSRNEAWKISKKLLVLLALQKYVQKEKMNQKINIKRK